MTDIEKFIYSKAVERPRIVKNNNHSKKEDELRKLFFVHAKRMTELEEKYGPEFIWDEDAKNLLSSYFGEFTDHIINGFNTVRYSLLSNYWGRRSFKAPNNPELYFPLQLQWVAELYQALGYDFSLEEYVRYSSWIIESGLSYLFAGAVEAGNEKIFNLMVDIVYGRDEVGKVSRSIIKALLLLDRDDARETIEKLLLSAQREEGLRQTILEVIDEGHPNNFKYFLEVILENKLTRFSSTVRAFDTWTGMGWEAPKEKTVKRAIELAVTYLNDTPAAMAALKSKDNLEIYMSLWSTGVNDLNQAVEMANELVNEENVATKLVSLYFLYQVSQSTEFNLETDFVKLLKSDSLAVVTLAFDSLSEKKKNDDIFDCIIDVLKRFEDKKVFDSGIFEWLNLQYDPDNLFNFVISAGKRLGRLDELMPFLDKMSADTRAEFVSKYLGTAVYSYYREPLNKELNEKQLAFALDRLSDRSSSVQDIAFRSLGAMKNLSPEDLEKVEALLGRKAATLRKNCVTLLMRQPLDSILPIVTKLSEAKSVEKRVAALDILLQLQKADCKKPQYFELIKSFKKREKLSARESALLENFNESEEQFNRENGFGLYNLNGVTKVNPPKHIGKFEQSATDPSSEKIFRFSVSEDTILSELRKLDKLIDDNKDYEFEELGWDGEAVTLLNKLSYRYCSIYNYNKEYLEKEYPFIDHWQKWFESSPLTVIDLCLLTDIKRQSFTDNEHWIQALQKKCYSELLSHKEFHENIKYMTQLRTVLDILFEYNFDSSLYDFVIDISETTFSLITETQLTSKVKQTYGGSIDWRIHSDFTKRLDFLDTEEILKDLSDLQLKRVWNLWRWYYESASKPNDEFLPCSLLYCEAYKRNIITHADLCNYLFEKPGAWREFVGDIAYPDMHLANNYPFINELMKPLLERVLEIELKRGDSKTEVTPVIPHIPQIFSMQYFFKILQGFGKEPFVRSAQYAWSWGNGDSLTKRDVFSMLLKRCHPTDSDSPKEFAKKVKELKIKDQRLIEAAMYAPQWLPFIAETLKWKSFASACWWVHAHTNENLNAMKESEIGQYSSVKANEFADGAVDVKWFFDFYKKIGEKNWSILYKSAKYISESTGHKRAQIFADALLGKLKLKDVEAKIVEKRNKDYLRAFGLIPLNMKKRHEDLLHRYKMVMQFKKESRQFGAQRQASEKIAAKIALDNLSRNAGYNDPIRLTWAMESQAAQDILEKAKPVLVGDFTISLNISEDGQASVVTAKNGKVLKNLPAKLRKDPQILELKEYAKELKEQYKRSRVALEEAMIRGDQFTYDEISSLMNHPVVAPLIKLLVLKKVDSEEIGFWQDDKLITSEDDSSILVKTDKLTIAHCLDLFNSGKWSTFQQICFAQQIKQPFKQIFREMYLPTPDEAKSKTVSRRYAGHQIQPKKTAALLKSRGWTIDYEEGLKKVFPENNYVVKIYAETDWFTPADVEAPTLESVEFYERDSYKTISFSKIDPVHFSETMRDLDLVVSVAHAGEVDPEASHSTVEMRNVLADETIRMLSLENVTSQKNHLIIEGKLKRYTLHLGSGVVHCQPGGALSILPVHSSHRGRIFLPFADNDPKTAEILSKMLLLANDDKIKDPTILEQINFVGR